MRRDLHSHTNDGELTIFWVPADSDLRPGLGCITRDLSAMSKIVDGWIEVIRSDHMPELSCGCRLVMVANEEGKLRNLPHNSRVDVYYPHDRILGDVFLVGEGLVEIDGETDINFFSLPPEFNDWEGPGAPLPTPRAFGS